MQKHVYWHERAIDFVRKTYQDRRGYKKEAFITFCLSIVKMCASADIVALLCYDNEFTASVAHAFPAYLESIVLPRQLVATLLPDERQEILYLSDLNREPGPDKIFTAMASGLMIPVLQRKRQSFLILGWSEQQLFDEAFRSFAAIVQLRFSEILRQLHYRQITREHMDQLTDMLNSLPQAVVYIDDKGYKGWLNFRAASLLKLPVFGEQPPELIAKAMQDLRSRAANLHEVEERAHDLVYSDAAAIDHWIWRYSDESLKFSTLRVATKPVHTAHHSGRIWVFEDVSDMKEEPDRQ